MLTPEQQAAFVMARSACAMITAMGMAAENDQRKALGQSMAYQDTDFQALIDQFGISHNAALNSLGLHG